MHTTRRDRIIRALLHAQDACETEMSRKRNAIHGNLMTVNT